MSRLVPLGEAAKRHETTYPTLRRRIRAGELRLYDNPLDRRFKLIDLDELDAYLAVRRVLPAGRKEDAAA